MMKWIRGLLGADSEIKIEVQISLLEEAERVIIVELVKLVGLERTE